MFRSIWFGAVLICLMFWGDAEACRRVGLRRTCNTGCGIPCWVQCKHFVASHDLKSTSTQCWCCVTGSIHFTLCGDGTKCEPNTTVYGPSQPPYDCGGRLPT